MGFFERWVGEIWAPFAPFQIGDAPLLLPYRFSKGRFGARITRKHTKTPYMVLKYALVGVSRNARTQI